MNTRIIDRERERANLLHQQLGAHIDEYLEEGFEGVAMHSSGTIFAVNQAAADMFGYQVDELLFQNALIFFPSDSAKMIMQQLLVHSTESYTVTARHKDGSLFKVQMKAREFEASGEPVRVAQLRRQG